MALTDQHKSSIRRHLKYGNIGISASAAGGGSLGASSGLRLFREWGELESRMDNITPIDEATLLGISYGLLIIQGLKPNSGDQLVLQISGGGLSSPQTITTTAAGETRDEFAMRVASRVAQNPLVNAARICAIAPSESGSVRQISQVQFSAPSPFLITIVSQTGNLGASLQADGTNKTDVYQTIDEVDYYGYLPLCNKLYSLIGTANDRMGVNKADVFTARKSEYQDRRLVYKHMIDEMADYLVARVNPDAFSSRPMNQGNL